MPVILNILPNVFWIYNNPSNIQPLNDYNIDVSKFVELNHISTIIDCPF